MRPAALLICAVLAACGTPPSSEPIAHVGPVTSIVALSANGTEYLFSASQAGVRAGPHWIRPDLRAFSIDVNASHLLIGGGEPAESGGVELFSARGERLATRELSEDLVYAVALHPTEPLAAVGCADGSVRILALPSLRTQVELKAHGAPCRALRFSLDGRRLASGGRDGLVFLHDLERRTHRTFVDHTGSVECLLFANDQLYSGASDGKVRVHTDTLIRTYLGLRGSVVGLCARNGSVLAALRDGRIASLHARGDTHSLFLDTGEELFALTAMIDGYAYGTVGGARKITADGSGKRRRHSP